MFDTVLTGNTGITPRLQLAQYCAGSKYCLASDFSTWVPLSPFLFRKVFQTFEYHLTCTLAFLLNKKVFPPKFTTDIARVIRNLGLSGIYLGHWNKNVFSLKWKWVPIRVYLNLSGCILIRIETVLWCMLDRLEPDRTKQITRIQTRKRAG